MYRFYLSDFPKMIATVILATLFFSSILSYQAYNFLPSNALFEIIFFSSVLFVFNYFNYKALLLSYFVLALLFSSFLVNVVYFNVGLRDYLIANKSFFYLSLLLLILNKDIFDVNFVDRLFKCMVLAFTFKYTAWIFFGFFNRPGLFFENNFELPFLLILYLTLLKLKKPVPLFFIILLFYVFFISRSMSGVLSISIVFIVINFVYLKKHFIKTLALLSLVFAILYYVISDRLGVGNIENVDRFVFLMEFLQSVDSRSFLSNIVGYIGLTPLPSSTCDRLSYYESLFSSTESNICYSLILHSYIMRIFYDHGLLGTLFVFFCAYFLVSRATSDKKIIFSLMSLIFVNSLSVSGLSNVFLVVGLMFFISSYNSEKSFEI